jgi:hypothetical protein
MKLRYSFPLSLPLLLLMLLPLTPAFTWTSVSVPTTCYKQWPCGFQAYYQGNATDYNQSVEIHVLEDGTSIEQVYETRSPDARNYQLGVVDNGSVLGVFTPGPFMATHRNYTLLLSYNGQETSSEFYLYVYRQPDILGDVAVWLNGPSIVYFIFGLIVLCLLMLIGRVFIGWVFWK